ncbi:hypothetical protein NL676_038255 [Syzygium grande]|nr:hypothetical protein NL676_038255 [Syzygium grande]
MATPLEAFVQISATWKACKTELKQRLSDSATQSIVGVIAARNALVVAEEHYYAEGCRVLNNRDVLVFNLAEARAIVKLFANFTAPFPLESVRIATVSPQGQAIDANIIEEMADILEMGGLLREQGYIFNLPVLQQ